MSYNPSREVAEVLDRAYGHITSAPYQVTARWVFYRLLQDGTLAEKSDYKRLLSYLSKARKQFYRRWTPATLADDTRAASVRGVGFESGQEWLGEVMEQTTCNLDRWSEQDRYVEVWFEASAMQAQFDFYTNENVPLLAFHGDVSIPEKWKATRRLVDRWMELEVPIVVLYYGDLDPKGLTIPESAHRDVINFAARYMWQKMGRDADRDALTEQFNRFLGDFTFTRVGLNDDQIALYGVPENPERPGTYQWEGLDDDAAQELIREVDRHLSMDGFRDVMSKEDDITQQFRNHLEDLTLDYLEE